MNGNERMPSALEDFDAIIRAGGSIDEAVDEAARENGLKPAAVRAKSEKAFGDLQAYRQQCLQVAAVNAARKDNMKPLANFIEEVYAATSASKLHFIPIGKFIRTTFQEDVAREEAFEFAREYQKKIRAC